VEAWAKEKVSHTTNPRLEFYMFPVLGKWLGGCVLASSRTTNLASGEDGQIFRPIFFQKANLNAILSIRILTQLLERWVKEVGPQCLLNG